MTSYAGIKRLLDDFQLKIYYLLRMSQARARDTSAALDLNIGDNDVHFRLLRQANSGFQPYLAVLDYTLISNNTHHAPPASAPRWSNLLQHPDLSLKSGDLISFYLTDRRLANSLPYLISYFTSKKNQAIF
jgi:hypothetical protein